MYFYVEVIHRKLAFSETSGKFCTLFFALLAGFVLPRIEPRSSGKRCTSEFFRRRSPAPETLIYRALTRALLLLLVLLRHVPVSTHKPQEIETNDPIEIMTVMLGGGTQEVEVGSCKFWFAFCSCGETP